MLMLISQKKYFVLHAPRQSGKTSCLLALRDLLNRESNYSALYMNVETAQMPEVILEEESKIIIGELALQMDRTRGDPYLKNQMTQSLDIYGPDAAL